MFDYQPCLRRAVIYNCYKVHPGKIPSFSKVFFVREKPQVSGKNPKYPGNIPIAVRQLVWPFPDGLFFPVTVHFSRLNGSTGDMR